MNSAVVDAVVVGAGPNGLVAANMLADAGWQVVVVEEQVEPGGAVRSVPGPAPGFRSDVCSAFYPLAAASPAITSLGLEEHGLRWVHAPAVLAHPLADGRAAVLSRELATTAAGLDDFAPGDGAAWARLYGWWERLGATLLDALATPFPPVLSGARLIGQLGPSGLPRAARAGLLPVRRLVEEEFSGAGAALLLAGCALHADLLPESAGSAALGWVLAMLGQQVGFPVPRGGAGELTGALVARLRARGGELVCAAPVRRVLVRRGRAVGVRTAAGTEIGARRAVLADVAATQLYGGLVDWDELPARLRQDMRRFHWDHAVFKVDWALSAPVPWTAPGARGAGTVHVAAGLDEMSASAAQLARGLLPDRPFLLVGQLTTSDPSRSPAGTESLWAYTRVPRQVRGDAGEGPDAPWAGGWDASGRERFAERIEAQLERFAPGFRDRVLGRSLSGPDQLAERDANLDGGALGGGTAAAHQQLMLRPTPGLGRPETPVAGLYLASASAHPGAGVHGACGANAARAALRAHRAHAQRVGAWASRAVIGR